MNKIAVLMVLSGALLLSSCNAQDSVLNTVESRAKSEQGCLVNQVMPSECALKKKQLRLALLEAKKQGVNDSRIDAAKYLGSESVAGSSRNSIYSSLSRNIQSASFRIKYSEDTYFFWSKSCTADAIENRGGLYQLNGYKQIGKMLHLVFVKYPPTCFDTQSMIQEHFPLVSGREIDALGSPLPETQSYHRPLGNDAESVKVHIASDFDDVKRTLTLIGKQPASEIQQERAKEAAKKRSEDVAREAAIKKARERKTNYPHGYGSNKSQLQSDYIRRIQKRIEKHWHQPFGGPKHGTCKVTIIQSRTGNVTNVDTRNCMNASSAFRRSITSAIDRSSPLPKAPNADTFDNEIILHFSGN